ncbi:alternative oxidase 2 [Striga asiatica]|uniref:Alternative oxidase 2 n=1 Tax=Striga asiatica TaxID=4170 RepID=A0A5A7Q4M6_STRAF|nr:alternative oxidase 2 [Striga asiatica]
MLLIVSPRKHMKLGRKEIGGRARDRLWGPFGSDYGCTQGYGEEQPRRHNTPKQVPSKSGGPIERGLQFPSSLFGVRYSLRPRVIHSTAPIGHCCVQSGVRGSQSSVVFILSIFSLLLRLVGLFPKTSESGITQLTTGTSAKGDGGCSLIKSFTVISSGGCIPSCGGLSDSQLNGSGLGSILRGGAHNVCGGAWVRAAGYKRVAPICAYL